jgi:hypothetical protein
MAGSGWRALTLMIVIAMKFQAERMMFQPRTIRYDGLTTLRVLVESSKEKALQLCYCGGGMPTQHCMWLQLNENYFMSSDSRAE